MRSAALFNVVVWCPLENMFSDVRCHHAVWKSNPCEPPMLFARSCCVAWNIIYYRFFSSSLSAYTLTLLSLYHHVTEKIKILTTSESVKIIVLCLLINYLRIFTRALFFLSLCSLIRNPICDCRWSSSDIIIGSVVVIIKFARLNEFNISSVLQRAKNNINGKWWRFQRESKNVRVFEEKMKLIKHFINFRDIYERCELSEMWRKDYVGVKFMISWWGWGERDIQIANEERDFSLLFIAKIKDRRLLCAPVGKLDGEFPQKSDDDAAVT